MSKEELLKAMEYVDTTNYRWNLYFLKIDRRNPNPYYVYKHTFKSTTYLPDYVMALRDTVIQYQINPLESVQEYDGQNSKTSCDKLCVDNMLIKEQWNNMYASVVGAPREQISGKYQGYILDGQPINPKDHAITIVKTGNPLISLEKKNSKVFKHTATDELEHITDDLCRLYMIADFMIIGDVLYSFNHNFESIFHIEKTLHRLKVKAIDYIIDTQAFDQSEKVSLYMNAYTAPKTFLTLRAQRVEKLNSVEGRKEVAERLNLRINDGKIVLEEQEQANQLIKYLCYKIFQDKETDKLIEVNSVVNDNVLRI